MHHNRATRCGGSVQGGAQRPDVVPVDRSDIVETHGVEQIPGTGRAFAQRAQVVGQRAGGRIVGSAVVVEHHHDRPPGGADVVHPLPGHSAGERTVTDHRDHSAVVLTA